MFDPNAVRLRGMVLLGLLGIAALVAAVLTDRLHWPSAVGVLLAALTVFIIAFASWWLARR